MQLRLEIADKDKTLYIVSDGGVYNCQSNFGAVIAASLSPLAHTYGKIYSIDFYESSYWSELYGMLAGVVMLQHILQTESLTLLEEKKIQIYCDNRSVVNKINERMKYCRTVNQHRHPDTDIEIQLIHQLQLLKEQKSKIKIEHVNGHQDNNPLQRTLRTEEHLNIYADDLTHKSRVLPTVSKYISFPENRVNLFIMRNALIPIIQDVQAQHIIALRYVNTTWINITGITQQ
jgi:hypothetical protein